MELQKMRCPKGFVRFYLCCLPVKVGLLLLCFVAMHFSFLCSTFSFTNQGKLVVSYQEEQREGTCSENEERRKIDCKYGGTRLSLTSKQYEEARGFSTFHVSAHRRGKLIRQLSLLLLLVKKETEISCTHVTI